MWEKPVHCSLGYVSFPKIKAIVGSSLTADLRQKLATKLLATMLKSRTCGDHLKRLFSQVPRSSISDDEQTPVTNTMLGKLNDLRYFAGHTLATAVQIVFPKLDINVFVIHTYLILAML